MSRALIKQDSKFTEVLRIIRAGLPKLASLVRVLPWTNNLPILGQTKRPHENPSVDVLLCNTKDDEVVEYAMSRHLSPALVAQYGTQIIPKAVLQQKLHEWSLMLQAPEAEAE
jgi:hypothetical protein